MVKTFDFNIRRWNVRKNPTFQSASCLTISNPVAVSPSVTWKCSSERDPPNQLCKLIQLTSFSSVTDRHRRFWIGEWFPTRVSRVPTDGPPIIVYQKDYTMRSGLSINSSFRQVSLPWLRCYFSHWPGPYSLSSSCRARPVTTYDTIF